MALCQREAGHSPRAHAGRTTTGRRLRDFSERASRAPRAPSPPQPPRAAGDARPLAAAGLALVESGSVGVHALHFALATVPNGVASDNELLQAPMSRKLGPLG